MQFILRKLGREEEAQAQEWARRDPDFDGIREDARFKALVGAG